MLMQKEVVEWYSPALNKNMPIAKYGKAGIALLMIPTAGADFLEYERFHLIEQLKNFIDSEKICVYSVDSINRESWLNDAMEAAHKAIRHNQYNEYVFNEVVPFIRNDLGRDCLIITCGASLGAFHSMNLFLKRPDLINGVIAMSGVYDLKAYTKGFWDDQVYYNSPTHYIPNLTQPAYLDKIKASHHIHLYTGSGNYEDVAANRNFSTILWQKGIWHDFDVWGSDIHHDWDSWRKMLPYIIGTKF